MVGDPSAQRVCLAPEVAHVTLDRRRINAGHLNGTRCSQARQRAVIEPQPCRAARSTGSTTGEHVLREGRGHADDVQVQVGRRIEENVILAGRPPEKVARRDRDGRFPVTERRVAGRDQVQLGLGVKMPRSPGRRDVMPDVTSCGAGDRKRLVQRLRHLSRLPELARVRPGAWRGPRRFPTKCEVSFSLQLWPRPRSNDSERLPSDRSRTVPSAPRIAVAVFLACANLSGVARAQTTKTFIDYIKPAPIVCAPLSSATWGVAGVLPRDTCNGIESARGAAVPPEFYYWDGQILKAKDGKYHMFMSTWSGTAGFNPGWTDSDAYHAISAQGVLGPYQRQGYVYTNNGSHKGHNVTALELPDGTYAVVVSETVAFTIYRSSSLDGPWTGCTASIQTNGVNAGTDAHYDSNVSLFPRHDGKFQIVQRHGLIAIADTLCGPYRMQKPTWTYPAANRPTIDSIYPRRTSIPGVSNPTYAWEEDPHIWRSGGIYHVLYSGSGDRVGWHLYSPDGINNWTDGGLSCNPRLYQKIFGYEGSTTTHAMVQDGAAWRGSGRRPPHPCHLGRGRCGQGQSDTGQFQSR